MSQLYNRIKNKMLQASISPENSSLAEVQKCDLSEHSLLARQLHPLVSSDLFSDVIFEVEDKKVPAHRNILVCRSEYFRAMLSENSKFEEAKVLNSIPIPDIAYDVFIQVLNFIYTGHIDLTKFSNDIAIELMRVSDRWNLVELEKLCLYHISKTIDKDNVCKIYKECYENEPHPESVLKLCYDQISVKFAYISKTEDFCALPQELMVKIVENVIPKLARLDSVRVNEIENID